MSAMNPESSIPRGHEPGPADGNFSSQASDVLRTGDQIAGCLIIRPLGRGINGAVYHAQQLAEEREVALRVLSRRVPQTDFVLQQGYVRESGASAWMTHPNIVRVHGAVTEGDRRCLIMDYVDGQSLEDRLAPGEPLRLYLYWQAENASTVPYTVFVQVLDSNGVLRAQQDQQPGDGAFPTTGWTPGEILTDTYRIDIPAELPVGRYSLVVGMYDPATSVRLPITAPDGRLVGDALELRSVEVQ